MECCRTCIGALFLNLRKMFGMPIFLIIDMFLGVVNMTGTIPVMKK